jgi:mono/diheme cytochrome c family protein
MQIRILGLALVGALAILAHADPDWSRNAPLPDGGRANPYELDPGPWSQSVRAGRLHALSYPVDVTALLLPYRPVASVLNGDSKNLLRRIVERAIGDISGFHSFDDVEHWLGMNEYPRQDGEIPFPGGVRPDHRMGFTLMATARGEAFTISCAECHSANLFGRKVLGMTNRFPRANEFFVRGLQVIPYISKTTFALASGASRAEAQMYADARYATQFIQARKPVQLGLDTSLAQVALSLDLRALDGWATRVPNGSTRQSPIADQVADSKPAVWWNVKYKNRWLSDGSVVSGNPILTNFLWNEIGRGTDLHDLDGWFARNPEVIRDLTEAVFATEPPQWTDFFPAEQISEREARQGQKLFTIHCSHCHGQYDKAWDLPEAAAWPAAQRIQTIAVHYPKSTPVVDVGTDPGRYLGMTSLAQLNALEISRRQGIVIEPQHGYVPPPLVGIWARWPYFHNNSAPSLCAVLTRTERRPVTYWARPAIHRDVDFDARCNGYPAAASSDSPDGNWLYDTRREGLSNRGHDEGIFLRNGQEIFSPEDKMALIAFLQTL